MNSPKKMLVVVLLGLWSCTQPPATRTPPAADTATIAQTTRPDGRPLDFAEPAIGAAISVVPQGARRMPNCDDRMGVSDCEYLVSGVRYLVYGGRLTRKCVHRDDLAEGQRFPLDINSSAPPDEVISLLAEQTGLAFVRHDIEGTVGVGNQTNATNSMGQEIALVVSYSTTVIDSVCVGGLAG